MQYDFDREVSRRGTSAVKWSVMHDDANPLVPRFTEEYFGQNRLLPMWVADMDFPSPQPVIDALVARAAHGLYGYTIPGDSFYEAVIGWMRRRHNWTIEREWLAVTPGIVSGLSLLVQTFAGPGDKILVQPPVYYPFYSVIENNGAQVVRNPLVFEHGRYRMDFDDLEAKASDPAVTMAILCSPHNPVGRVWTADELARFGEICLKHNVLVVSDEVHGDLILPGGRFTPFATVRPEFGRRAIICTAPSKTFNLAGLKTSCLVIADAERRAAFDRTLHSHGILGASVFGAVALEAAYNHGEEWLEQALAYIQGNLEFLQSFVAAHLPQITVAPLEGTYLAWLDCRRLGLDRQALKRLMLDEARVYFDEGYMFGDEGEGFERVNIACPRSILAEALDRIRAAVERLERRRA